MSINNDNLQKHNQLMILMRSDFCHSVENQNKIFRPRSIIVILCTKYWSNTSQHLWLFSTPSKDGRVVTWKM